MTLPAGGKTDITVTMTLTEAQKKALDEKYESGAYVQGYVFAAPLPPARGSECNPLHSGTGFLWKLDRRLYV